MWCPGAYPGWVWVGVPGGMYLLQGWVGSTLLLTGPGWVCMAGYTAAVRSGLRKVSHRNETQTGVRVRLTRADIHARGGPAKGIYISS